MLIKKSITFTLLSFIFLTSCASVDENRFLPTFQNLSVETSLNDFIKLYGPPFSITQKDDGIELVYYYRFGKTSPAVWIPVVNLVASGNTNTVQRNVLKFDKNDYFSEVIDVQQKKNFTSVYTMVSKEGMTGTGGMRNNYAYQVVGEYLAEKGIFFNQEMWKSQNVSNNYWNK